MNTFLCQKTNVFNVKTAATARSAAKLRITSNFYYTAIYKLSKKTVIFKITVTEAQQK